MKVQHLPSPRSSLQECPWTITIGRERLRCDLGCHQGTTHTHFAKDDWEQIVEVVFHEPATVTEGIVLGNG